VIEKHFPEDQHAQTESGIERIELVTDLFGHWPHFHDAHILALRLTAPGPALEADVWVFETLDETDETTGFLRVSQQADITLRFERITQLLVADFTEDHNIMGDLVIGDASALPVDDDADRRRYRVHFQPIYGCEVEFLCDSIAVVAAAVADRVGK
jgi:hypothetical protein